MKKRLDSNDCQSLAMSIMENLFHERSYAERVTEDMPERWSIATRSSFAVRTATLSLDGKPVIEIHQGHHGRLNILTHPDLSEAQAEKILGTFERSALKICQQDFDARADEREALHGAIEELPGP